MPPRLNPRESVEELLREACEVWGIAEGARCLPSGASAMAALGRAPSRREAERLGLAIVLVTTAGLTAEQRELLWRRAQGTPWKTLTHETGVPISTLSDRYDEALAALNRHRNSSPFIVVRARK